MIEDQHEQKLNPSCREFQANLETYLEGEVGFPDHAGQCADCGALFADLALIRSAAQCLPLESPSPRVWSNVRASLEAEGYFREKENFWKKWLAPLHLPASAATVGSLVILVVLAVFLLSPGDLYRRSQPTGTPAVATSVASAGMTTVEEKLVRTVQEMEKSYKARESFLDPSAQQTYARGLTSLDSSIRECLTSLQAQPQNTLARRYLMQAYSEKADVLASALEYDGR